MWRSCRGKNLDIVWIALSANVILMYTNVIQPNNFIKGDVYFLMLNTFSYPSLSVSKSFVGWFSQKTVKTQTVSKHCSVYLRIPTSTAQEQQCGWTRIFEYSFGGVGIRFSILRFEYSFLFFPEHLASPAKRFSFALEYESPMSERHDSVHLEERQKCLSWVGAL